MKLKNRFNNVLFNILFGFLIYTFVNISFPFSTYAQTVKRPPILGIAHVSFKVSDIEKARKYYSEYLGFEEPFSLYKDDGSVDITFFKINGRQYIEIRPNLKPNEIDRLSHICFETTDLEEMRKYLASKGIEVPEKVNKGRDKNIHFTVFDPDGHMIEFMEYLPGSKHKEITGKYLSDKRISNRLIHAGFTVKDIEKADKFYKDILGFSEFWRGGVTDTATDYINMKMGESTDYIEYMVINGEMPTKRLPAYNHAALMVKDMQESIETLREREGGQKNLSPKIGKSNRWLLNTFDPDGTRVELMELHTIR